MKNLLKLLLVLLFFTFSANVLVAQSFINGNLWYNMDPAKPLAKVKVTLNLIDGQNNKSWTCHTDNNGIYEFLYLKPGTYKISFSSTLKAAQVTQADADLLWDYIYKGAPLTAMQLLAADIDGSGDVTIADYNLLLAHIYQDVPFPTGDWQFQTLMITLTSGGLKSADGDPKDLGGICSGDVGGTFVPGTKSMDAIPLDKSNEVCLKIENYPNPFTSSTTLTIKSPQAGKANLQLFDMSGRMVKIISLGYLQQGIQEIKINTEELTKGKYICQLQVNGINISVNKTFSIMKAD